MRMMKRLGILLASVVFGAGAVAACGAGGETSQLENTGSSSGSSGNTGGGGGINFTSGSGGGGVGGGETCKADVAQAQKIPLDMIVVLDRSGSMGGSVGSLWDSSVTALKAFFNDPASAGISVGINFFPPEGQNCTVDSDCLSGTCSTTTMKCNPDDCEPLEYNPPQVDLGILPNDAMSLAGSLDATSPSGTTPTYGALFGTYQWATAHQDANPDRKVIIVFASDGDPTDCDTNIASITGVVASAYNYNSVETYAIVLSGADATDLNAIAAAGGTDMALDVTLDISLFAAKMEEIRSKALGCEYLIPEQQGGQEFDPTKLNMTYTPGGGGLQQELPQAANEADCGATPGWYYDDPVVPTKIFLCPGSCNTIQADTNGVVDLEFGCPTKMN
jgi:hypothetical protein